jgi:5-methylcytosine-specific restriction endonuclease McrA
MIELFKIQLQIVEKLTIDYETNWYNLFTVDALLLKNELREELIQLHYEDFLCTNYWRTISTMLRNEYPKCQKCRKTGKLIVHHKTYIHHGEEHLHLEDLKVLCNSCHTKEHNRIRSLQNKCDVDADNYTISLSKRNDDAIKPQITQQRKKIIIPTLVA